MTKLGCGCVLCGACATALVVRGHPAAPTCPVHGTQAGRMWVCRVQLARSQRRRGGGGACAAETGPLPVVETELELGSAPGIPGSLDLAFKHTSADGRTVTMRCGSLREENPAEPRQSRPDPSDPFGDAAAEQALLQLGLLLNLYVIRPEARWDTRAMRLLRATDDGDVEGHGTACGLYNRGVANNGLTHLFYRAIGLGPASITPAKPTETLTRGAFARLGAELKTMTITCIVQTEQSFKLNSRDKGGGAQLDTLDMLWANGADNTAVMEYLRLASLCIRKPAEQPKTASLVATANAATLEREWQLVGANVSRQNVLGKYIDNVSAHYCTHVRMCTHACVHPPPPPDCRPS